MIRSRGYRKLATSVEECGIVGAMDQKENRGDVIEAEMSQVWINKILRENTKIYL